ncbi:alpha/beta-hydrolase [Aspergillus sclerotiicarbonarius CBS 121057]|uniref:Alpha/beta-hydrolase n=1 Tax=Aspergillus sclerotiicarbonarius (strain CBS 121057 / IBT 28362) TaxID=1448318 RepID=A0A319E972_ASPSB|nr:alpha/beta-hydrolase [Aspergillus sclerotiicarbonarius CBS 121057]
MAANETPRFTVVICTGSYHTPAPFEPFRQALESNGFEAYCPQRPTCDLKRLNVGDINNPDFDLGPPPEGYPSELDDVQVIDQLLDKLINQESKQVLLLGHSSGGLVAAQAATPGLQYKSRQAKGQSGGVIGIFYVGAFVIPVGESVHTFFQPKEGPLVTPPFMRFHKHGFDGLGTVVEAHRYIFDGLDPEEAAKWAATLTASPISTGVLTNDATSALPCAYLVLDNDCTLPREYQEGMIALETQRGNTFTVYHAQSGHSPHLSWTDQLVGKVAEFTNQCHPH